MNKIKETIDNVCKAIDRQVQSTNDPEVVMSAAKAVDTLVKASVLVKEVELHEKFHLDAQNQLPGEDPLEMFKN